ncbi:MAG TPA: YgjV family protein [Gemmatimonadales bacterium]|nr:YgjV family protein [Gemmatimonadales bacterium]
MKAADALGWLATAVFLASYSRKSQQALRLTQAAAALLWVVYGILLHSLPIIVANLLVAAVAAYSSRTEAAPERSPAITTSVEPDLSRIS